jgi:hypothetical protein
MIIILTFVLKFDPMEELIIKVKEGDKVKTKDVAIATSFSLCLWHGRNIAYIKLYANEVDFNLTWNLCINKLI